MTIPGTTYIVTPDLKIINSKTNKENRCTNISVLMDDGLRHGFRRERLLWCEPPYSEEGKKAGVYHYRLFCDENWQPIFPRGEVYSTQFTEMGWKSFSELHRII